jgi:hypothetical protein
MDYTSLSHILGFTLIWFAVSYNRNDKSKIMIFTKEWFVVFTLVVAGGFLLI